MAGHPWFSSGLEWHTRLDDALAAAAAGKRRIMLVVGKPLCAGSRALIERTLAKEELEEYTRQHFVLLAVDAEAAPEPRVAEIVARLPVKAPTPLIAYLTVDGKLVGASAGGRPPAVLLNDMLGATSKKP
jgi:thioredoxin-related protein